MRILFSRIRYRVAANEPKASPAIIPAPPSESADKALKKPPMLQPKASIAPIPMSRPPRPPLTSSSTGAGRMANSRLNSAAASAPKRTPKFSTEPE
jgi:hypothetical protein